MSCKMTVMCFIVTALLILLQITCQNQVKKDFLCVDEDCSKPISRFKVTNNYNAPNSPDKISASKGDVGLILAKPQDKNSDMLKVKIGEKSGFLSKRFIQEALTYVKDMELKPVKLHVPVDTVLTKNPADEPRGTSGPVDHKPDTNNEQGILTDEVKDNATGDSALSVDQLTDSNYTADQIPLERSNDSIFIQVDDSSAENNLESDTSAEMRNRIKPTLNPLLQKGINLLDKEAVDDKEKSDSKPLKTDGQEPLQGNLTLIGTFKSDSEKPDDFSSHSAPQNLPEPKNFVASRTDVPDTPPPTENSTSADNQTISSAVENIEIIKKLNSSIENVETEKKPVTSEKSEAESKSENSAGHEPAISSEPVSAEDFVDNSAGKQITTENPEDKEDKAEPVTNPEKIISLQTENVSSSDLLQNAPQPEITVTEISEIAVKNESFDNSTISESVNLETKNGSSNTFQDASSNIQVPKNESKEMTTDSNQDAAQVSSESTKSNASEHQILSESTAAVTHFPSQSASVKVEDEKHSSSETIPESENVTNSFAITDIDNSNVTEDNIVQTTENVPPASLDQGSIDQSGSFLTENVSNKESPEEQPTTESLNPLETSTPETSLTGIDVDKQQGGLNEFIHAPRKKSNENEVEGSDSQPGKSIYETIQDYLPDFSTFQVDDILPMSSIESVKNFFDFGFSSQKHEDEEEGHCSADGFCGTERLNSFMSDKLYKPSQKIVLPLWGELSNEDKEIMVWVGGIASVLILVVILSLSWIVLARKNNRESLLVTRINRLEKKLLVATKEIVVLQDQVAETGVQSKTEQNVVETKKIQQVYEHKVNQYKKRVVELEDKVLYLEKELENVTSSALEMHKLLENSLATQSHSKAAIDEVETLRALTESQEIQIEELRREINSIVTENQCLKVDNEMDKSTIKKLEKECSLQIKKNLELSEKNKNLTLQLDKEIENNNSLESNYKSEIYQLRSKLEDVEMNLKRSEFQVQELNRAFVDKQEGKSPAQVQAACDDMQLKVQISTLEAMNVELGGQLKDEKNARRMLEDHVGDVIKELNNLKKTYEISEKERNEAVTKLQVLTQYFKDKEAQLHKELEAKDKLYSERESKDQSLSQKLASMREEISNLKTQNEELKKEILDQEASFKVQLANAEQKTREHWFALRQAERKYKECEQEASNLRNKIVLLENKLSSLSQKADDKNNSGLNGDMSSMMYHPPLSPDLLPYPSPSEFIPPPPSPIPSHSPDFFPPEPLYSPDERLPPLGGRRAPTPPPPGIPDDDEFTPPPPIMKFPSSRSRNEPPVPSYSRRTPPPSARPRSQFKPRQPRSSIDSPSSGMSLESLDKSGR